MGTPVERGELRTKWRVINGRFVGGYITRHFGRSDRIQAVQLELSQATYMDEANRVWDDERAAGVIPVIRQLIQTLEAWSPETE